MTTVVLLVPVWITICNTILLGVLLWLVSDIRNRLRVAGTDPAYLHIALAGEDLPGEFIPPEPRCISAPRPKPRSRL